MKTIEISIKEMIVSVLYNWVPILLSTLVFAALFGAYTYLTQPRGAEYEALPAKYEQDMQDMQAAQAEAQQEIAVLETKRQALDAFIKSNQATSASSKREVSYLSFRISVNPVIVNIYTVAGEYISLYNKASLKDIFKDVLPKEYDESFLRALVALNEDKQGAFDPIDAGFMTIRTIGIDSLDASVLADTLYGYFVSNQATVASAAGDNTLSIVEKKKASSGDANKRIDAVLADQRNLITEYEKEITSIRDGVLTVQSKKPDVMGKIMGNMVSGAIIGFVLGLLVVAIGYMYRLPVLVPELPQTQLGIRYLGGIRRKKGVLFARLGDKLAGNFLLPKNAAEAIAYVSANINEVINKNAKVLITGTLPLANIREFAQKLTEANKEKNYEYLISDSVNKSDDAINKLSVADAVILVERLRVSTLRNMNREQERIKISGKNIVGYVLY